MNNNLGIITFYFYNPTYQPLKLYTLLMPQTY